MSKTISSQKRPLFRIKKKEPIDDNDDDFIDVSAESSESPIQPVPTHHTPDERPKKIVHRNYENRELFMQLASQIQCGCHDSTTLMESISYVGTNKEFSAALSMLVKRGHLKSEKIPNSHNNRKSYHLTKKGFKLIQDIENGYKKIGKSNQHVSVFNVHSSVSSGGVGGIPKPYMCGDEKSESKIKELQKQIDEKDKQLAEKDNTIIQKDVNLSVERAKNAPQHPVQPVSMSPIIESKKKPKLRESRENVIRIYKNKNRYLDLNFIQKWKNLNYYYTHTVNLNDRMSRTQGYAIVSPNNSKIKNNGKKGMQYTQIFSNDKVLDAEFRIINVRNDHIIVGDRFGGSHKLNY